MQIMGGVPILAQRSNWPKSGRLLQSSPRPTTRHWRRASTVAENVSLLLKADSEGPANDA